MNYAVGKMTNEIIEEDEFEIESEEIVSKSSELHDNKQESNPPSLIVVNELSEVSSTQQII